MYKHYHINYMECGVYRRYEGNPDEIIMYCFCKRIMQECAATHTAAFIYSYINTNSALLLK